MKKFVTKLVNFIFGVIVLVLVTYILGMRFFPDQLKKYVGYQTFVILTDSMEPTIPVGSLVISKNIKDAEDISENTIISFRVDRFGDDTVFTHYFKKRELDETGRVRYFTVAENASRYDDYVTYEEDILGTYVVHIPYIGKLVMFLQSPFALIELGIILFIMLLNRILWDKFDREEKEALADGETEENIVDAEGMRELELNTEPDSEEMEQVFLEEAEDTVEIGGESPKENIEQMVLEPEAADTRQMEPGEETVNTEVENSMVTAPLSKIKDKKPKKKLDKKQKKVKKKGKKKKDNKK